MERVSYLKNLYTIQYQYLENKLRKFLNKHIRNFSSKRILEFNFIENSPFKFLQIGANDGASFDTLYEFLKTRNAEGVVIEPVSEYFNDLKINFEYNSKILAINKAIHPTASEVTMYKIKPSSLHQYPDWIKGIASLDKNHYLKSKVDRIDIIEELVKAETLNSILDENPSLKDIDYLQIDTEGFDYEVLKMVDFKLLNPKMIKFESVNLNLKEKIASKNLLIKYGYYNFDEFGDTISIDLKRIKIL